MFRHSRSTQVGIAAISLLAEHYGQRQVWLTASRIAAVRQLSRPVVAKTLSALARSHLILGSRGRGGGYRLAREPGTISLLDVANVFKKLKKPPCPYGPRHCGMKPPCPLHDALTAMHRLTEDYLRNTRLDVFVRSHPAALKTAVAGADRGASRPARARGSKRAAVHCNP